MTGTGPCLLLIQDQNNYIFGAYCTHKWKITSKVKGFYGTGECFLFSFNDTEYIRYYPWSKKNSYFMFSNLDGLSIGTG